MSVLFKSSIITNATKNVIVKRTCFMPDKAGAVKTLEKISTSTHANIACLYIDIYLYADNLTLPQKNPECFRFSVTAVANNLPLRVNKLCELRVFVQSEIKIRRCVYTKSPVNSIVIFVQILRD